MFFHTKHLQYHAKPERPDPLYARSCRRSWAASGAR